MLNNNKLKILLLVPHFFILIAAGHGVAPLGFIEIFSLFRDAGSWGFVAFVVLLGQAAIVASMIVRKGEWKGLLYGTGIVLLWLSIFWWSYFVADEKIIFISYLSIVPFGICTLVVFVGRAVRNAWSRYLDA